MCATLACVVWFIRLRSLDNITCLTLVVSHNEIQPHHVQETQPHSVSRKNPKMQMYKYDL